MKHVYSSCIFSWCCIFASSCPPTTLCCCPGSIPLGQNLGMVKKKQNLGWVRQGCHLGYLSVTSRGAICAFLSTLTDVGFVCGRKSSVNVNVGSTG